MTAKESQSSQRGKDVLIRSTRGELSHKYADNVPVGHECYWTVNGTPRQTRAGNRIWFAYGGRLVATSEITSVEEGRIWFEPLEGASGPAPEKPPTRGYKYVEPMEEC